MKKKRECVSVEDLIAFKRQAILNRKKVFVFPKVSDEYCGPINTIFTKT